MSRFISPLVWIGGKEKQWPLIKQYLPKNSKDLVYVDLFLGGGSTFLRVIDNQLFKKYWANDLNKDLIGFWKWLQDGKEIITSLMLTHLKNFEVINQYYPNLSKPEQFFWDNMLSYNGLKKGTWSQQKLEQNFVPSKYTRALYAQSLIQSYGNFPELLNLEYWQAIAYVWDQTEVEHHYFFFIDPPYFNVKAKKLYAEYSNLDFEKFVLDVKSINKRNDKFLITICDTPEVREAFKGFYIYPQEWKYTSQNAKGGVIKNGKELFITNYEA